MPRCQHGEAISAYSVLTPIFLKMTAKCFNAGVFATFARPSRRLRPNSHIVDLYVPILDLTVPKNILFQFTKTSIKEKLTRIFVFEVLGYRSGLRGTLHRSISSV
jgi:hypothetical protein